MVSIIIGLFSFGVFLAFCLALVGIFYFFHIQKNSKIYERALYAFNAEKFKHEYTSVQEDACKIIRNEFIEFMSRENYYKDPKAYGAKKLPEEHRCMLEKVRTYVNKYRLPKDLYMVIDRYSFSHLIDVADKAKQHQELTQYARTIGKCT